MDAYYIDNNEENTKNPFFIWFLIFSDMLQLFNDLKDFRDLCKSADQEDGGKLHPIFWRVYYGYHNEFQSTIRTFLHSSNYDSLIGYLKDHHPYMCRELFALKKEWKTHYQEYTENNNTIEPHNYFKLMRNSYFHFAPQIKDCESYKKRYEDMVHDVKDNYADRQLTFCTGDQTNGAPIQLENIRDFLKAYAVTCSFYTAYKNGPSDNSNKEVVNEMSVEIITDSYQFIVYRCMDVIWYSLLCALLDDKIVKAGSVDQQDLSLKTDV